MARQLEPRLEATLGTGENAVTALRITLGDGTPLLIATSEFTLGDETFLGVMEISDSYNMELTAAEDAMNFQLTNIELDLGRFLINTPDVLSGTEAMLCVYIRNTDTGEEWLEEKSPGEIRITGEMNGEVIPLKFVSDLDSGVYFGETLGKLFPDAENAVQITIPPVNDVFNSSPAEIYSPGYNPDGNFFSPMRWKYDQYVLPEMNLLQ